MQDTEFEHISLLHHKPLSAVSSTSAGSSELVSMNSALPQLPHWPSLCVVSEAILCSPAQLCFFSLVSARWQSSQFILWFPLSDVREADIGLSESFPKLGVGVS